MKTLIILSAMFFAFASVSYAQATRTVTIKAGQAKTESRSKLKIKFISVIEDSRCPEGVNCIWAGNAKIKVEIKSSRTTKIFEFNTGMGPKGDILDGWAINLEELTPYPKNNITTDPKRYQAKFTIVRLTR